MLSVESFTDAATGGELPKDLFGVTGRLNDRVESILAAITVVVTAAGLTGASAEDLIRHGVLARIYRAATAYYAKRPTSAQLADQGGVTWGNAAAIYADLAKQEQTAFDSGLAAVVSVAIATTFPGGSVPTRITP